MVADSYVAQRGAFAKYVCLRPEAVTAQRAAVELEMLNDTIYREFTVPFRRFANIINTRNMS